MSATRIRLHIDELALHGFVPGDSAAIALALREHLTGLIRAEGVPSSLRQGGRIATLPGAEISATATSDPTATGSDIARAIFGSMNR